jgi:hypothetical protein
MPAPPGIAVVGCDTMTRMKTNTRIPVVTHALGWDASQRGHSGILDMPVLHTVDGTGAEIFTLYKVQLSPNRTRGRGSCAGFFLGLFVWFISVWVLGSCTVQ